MPRKRIPFVAASLALIALLVIGCSDSSPSKPEEEELYFGDLTEREDIIRNLVLSYREKDIAEYSRLLLRAEDTFGGSTYPNEYYWYHQPYEIMIEDYLTREEDIGCTGNIFLAAQGTPAKPEHPVIERLVLQLTDGTFSPVDSLFGEPCEDCWSTEREYYLRLELGGDMTINSSYHLLLYIVPVDGEGTKIYKVAQANDVYAD